MDETEVNHYTFDLSSIGTILAPGRFSVRHTVYQGTESEPLDGNDAVALVRALNVLAKNKRMALAVRQEINRLHDPAEYESQAELLAAQAQGLTRYALCYVHRGPGERKEFESVEVFAPDEESAVRQGIAQILDDDNSDEEWQKPILDSLKFTLKPIEGTEEVKSVIIDPSTKEYVRGWSDDDGGIELYDSTIERLSLR